MARDKVRRIDFSPDEYIAGVGAKLTAEQQGVYWLVCALIYSEGGPVDDDAERIGLLCKLRPSSAARILQQLVDMEKLHRSGGKLSQNRSEKELQRAAKRIETATENGQKGGRPRRISHADQGEPKAAGFPDENLTINQQLATINQQPAEEGRDAALSAEMLEQFADDPLAMPERRVIRAFDRARVQAFGGAQARAFPQVDDRQHAGRFLAAGASPELCFDVFLAVMQRMQANGRQPPANLAYMAGAVSDALAAARRPMPAGATPAGTGARFDVDAFLQRKAAAS